MQFVLFLYESTTFLGAHYRPTHSDTLGRTRVLVTTSSPYSKAFNRSAEESILPGYLHAIALIAAYVCSFAVRPRNSGRIQLCQLLRNHLEDGQFPPYGNGRARYGSRDRTTRLAPSRRGTTWFSTAWRAQGVSVFAAQDLFLDVHVIGHASSCGVAIPDSYFSVMWIRGLRQLGQRVFNCVLTDSQASFS